MKKRKRRLRKSIKYALYAISAILVVWFVGLGVLLIFNSGTKSVNEDAKRYKNGKCIAFYPAGMGSEGKDFAASLCLDKEVEAVYDYEVSKMGDYFKYDYGQNNAYIKDAEFKDPKMGDLSEKGQMIVSDYLRYTLKKNGLDYAYSLHFLEESYYPNIAKEDFTYRFTHKDLVLYFEEYDAEVAIPLKTISNEVGINLGYTNEAYIKPTYVDPNRKAIALTFDDGPSLSEGATNKIIDELYKYDSVGTFFVLGSRLYEKTEPLLAKSIALGNQYGSHSCSHPNLKGLSSAEIYEEVMAVSDYLKEELNYDMQVYRPPYGAYNELVDETIPVAAILWDVDSVDWQSRDAKAVYSEIKDYVRNHSVVLMHDIYDSTASALVDENLICDLINEGYQLVSVSDIAKLRGVDLVQGVHLCWDKK